jgi:gliding motility-associated-like protein
MNRNNLLTLVLSCFCLVKSTFAQIQVNDATVAPFTPENLVSNYFLGEGVQVLSVQYEGAAAAVGYFNNAQSRIGINRGIALTNGFVQSMGSGATTRFGIDADGNNTANNDNKNNPKDIDIDAIIKASGADITKIKSHNLSKYTIKFIPTSDTLSFRYVFASEEYPTYICDQYNDIFGFFISGPGINGPYENNGQNIALIPGTNLPVTINNVNLGNSSKPNCPPRFAKYYNDNSKSNKQPVYDAFLKVFTAQAIVQPCQEYTIKLIIADVGDAGYDSGVFLEAKSFGTGAIRVDRVTAASDNNIIEGCTPGVIAFNLPKKAEKDTPLDVKILGSAVNGVDYKLIATNFFIPKGDSSLKVTINAIQDKLFEGTESIGFDVQRDICNRDTFWFNIKDNTLNAVQRKTIADSTICKGQQINFDATIALAPPPNPSFSNSDSTAIKTIISGSSVTPTILPILVSNVSPVQFSPNMIESVCVNLKHTWVDDIDLYLVAPNGQFIALSTDNGGDGDNMKNACFKPSAKNNIMTGTAPFTGDWLPEDSFTELLNGNNNPTNGLWKLLVIDDDAAGTAGKIQNWNITFKSNYKIDYQWNTNQNITCSDCAKPTVSPKSSFDYVVRIEDVYGCAIRDTAKITLKDSIAAPSLLCGVVTHNSLTYSWLNIADAKGYEVSVNGGAWQNNALAITYKVGSLAPNTPVTLSVRGTGGLCFAKTSTLVCNTLPCTTLTPKIDDLKPITCKGKKDGEIKLSVTAGGTPPYKYSLGANNNSIGTFSNLAAGKYLVSIEDVNGCPALANFQIVEPELLKLKLAADSASCPTASDAVALAEASGGSMPYTYRWGSGNTNDLEKDLKAGTQFITLTDAAGCKVTDSIKIFEPKSMTIRVLQGEVTCSTKEDGTLSANIETGGTFPFSFLWDTGTSLQPISKIIGLKPGLYQLSVVDAHGCQSTTATILDPAVPITMTSKWTDNNCFGDKTGKIDLKLSGGTNPYKYAWNNKDSTAIISNLTAGKYTVTVTDKYKCPLVATVDISSPDSLQIASKITPLNCFGESTAAIETTVTGGNGNFTYLWSNSKISKDINSLKSGSYIVTITDNKNCTAKKSFDIKAPDSLSIQGVANNSDCTANNSGSININVSGGAAPYTFAWAGPNNFSASVQNIKDLPSGKYTVTLSDNKGCTKTKNFDIKQPTTFSVSAVITDVKCRGGATGAIKLQINGGTPPINFNWENGVKLDNITSLKSGDYKVTITDNSGCATNSTFPVGQPDSLILNFTKVDSLCNGLKGEAEVKVKGGVLPYIYDWASGENTAKIKNLAKGNYTVTVTDKNACTATQSTDIFINNPLKISWLETASSCNNGTDGKITLTKISFDTAPEDLATFNYKWSNNTFTKDIVNAKGGQTYNVTVTSSKGCTAVEAIKITNPALTTIGLKKVTQPSCVKGNDGAIECIGEGGTAPYTFEWSNGVQSAALSSLIQGDYSVTMSDNKGCTATRSVTMLKPNSFTIKILATDMKCADVANGTASVTTQGGNPPFQYVWNKGETSATIKNLSLGTYAVTVTDASGCEQQGTAQVSSPPALEATILASPVHCGGRSDGTFTVLPKGGNSPYLYSVNGDAFNGQYKRIGLRANVYEVTVKDANDCLFSATTSVTEPEPIRIDLGKDTALQFGGSYRIPTQVFNAIGNDPKYTWFPDDNQHISCINCLNPIVSPRISTLYTLTVKDSVGCSASKSINVTIKVSTNVAVPTGFSPNGDGENDLLLVHGDSGATVLEFRIFDRWGNMIYEKNNFPVNDKTTGWDGFFREESMPSGNYIWTLAVRFKNDSVEYFKGSTMLIR